MFGGLIHKIVSRGSTSSLFRYFFDFSNSTGIILSNSASILNNELILTPNISNSTGSAEFSNIKFKEKRYFKMSFDYRIFDGGGADGLGFELSVIAAQPLLGGNRYRSQGLRFFIDTYNNSGDGVGIKFYRDVSNRFFYSNSGLRNNSYRRLNFEADKSKKQINFSIDGLVSKTIIDLSSTSCNFFDTAASNLDLYRLRFYGVTGGLSDKHSIKNLLLEIE